MSGWRVPEACAGGLSPLHGSLAALAVLLGCALDGLMLILSVVCVDAMQRDALTGRCEWRMASQGALADLLMMMLDPFEDLGSEL